MIWSEISKFVKHNKFVNHGEVSMPISQTFKIVKSTMDKKEKNFAMRVCNLAMANDGKDFLKMSKFIKGSFDANVRYLYPHTRRHHVHGGYIILFIYLFAHWAAIDADSQLYTIFHSAQN